MRSDMNLPEHINRASLPVQVTGPCAGSMPRIKKPVLKDYRFLQKFLYSFKINCIKSKWIKK